MSVSHRTTRALPLLTHVQHNALESVEQGELVCDDMTTRKEIDKRSDAKLEEVRARLDTIRRLIPVDPQSAYREALIASADLNEGITLDSYEDPPCERTEESASTIQQLGRATVARLQGAWGGGPEPAA